MEYVEKIKKRLEHWKEHNNKHIEEYKKLAEELKLNGLVEASKYILNLVEQTKRMNKDIEDALRHL